MDTTIPVEDLVGAIADQVQAGYVRHIGLTMVDVETLRRACRVHPIHTVEMEYSLLNRSIERELIAAAKELGVKVLAFGTVGHGLLRDDIMHQRIPHRRDIDRAAHSLYRSCLRYGKKHP